MPGSSRPQAAFSLGIELVNIRVQCPVLGRHGRLAGESRHDGQMRGGHRQAGHSRTVFLRPVDGTAAQAAADVQQPGRRLARHIPRPGRVPQSRLLRVDEALLWQLGAPVAPGRATAAVPAAGRDVVPR
jgi:hypothetical protein